MKCVAPSVAFGDTSPNVASLLGEETVSPPSERSERWGEYRRSRGGGL